MAVPLSGPPAAAAGSVFGVDLVDGVARRYDLATGAVTGTWPGDGDLEGTPVVTDDAVIVSSATRTWVYALATGAELDTVPDGGVVTVARNRLVLVDRTGHLRVWSW